MGRMLRRLVTLALLPAAALAADPAPPPPAPAPAGQPLWELGVGAAALRLPDYRGADEGRNYLLPLPYVVYRGTWLKADREGARAVLLDTARVDMDVSVSATAPARSKDNAARRGMPDLKGLGEIGPNLNLRLAGTLAEDGWKLDLRLPLRAAFTLERSPRFVGHTFSPNLNLDFARVGGGWNVGLLTGPVYGDGKYHRHFYGVDAGQATAARPAYAAHGGYGGWQALAAASRRMGNMWVGAFVRYDRLDGAVFDDSPLLRRKSALAFGVGLSWVLATSSERVASPD